MGQSSDASGPVLRLVLVDESLWSRGLFRLPPIARSDLLVHLGQQLDRFHSDILEDPVPDRIGEVIGRAATSGRSPLLDGEPASDLARDAHAARPPE